MTYTRKQRLNNECTHREYYAQFVNKHTIETVVRYIGEKRLLASTDQDAAFNDIPLNMWDMIHVGPGTVKKLQDLGDIVTLAGAVCIHKEAARQFVESQS